MQIEQWESYHVEFLSEEKVIWQDGSRLVELPFTPIIPHNHSHMIVVKVMIPKVILDCTLKLHLSEIFVFMAMMR